MQILNPPKQNKLKLILYVFFVQICLKHGNYSIIRKRYDGLVLPVVQTLKDTFTDIIPTQYF